MAKAVKATVRKEKAAPGASAKNGGIKHSDFVSALARGIEILRLFSESRPRITTSEAADLTGLSRAAVRRFLLTLTELGYLRNEQEYFEPTPKILEFGYAYLSSLNFDELVRPYLKEVVDALHENCSFAILDGGEVIYLVRSEARRIVQSIAISVGTRVPASLSALGRVQLAYQAPEIIEEFIQAHSSNSSGSRTITDPILFRNRLDLVRKQGWAIVENEFEEGLISIAVPILADDNKVIGAINVGAPTSRSNVAQMEEEFLPVLQKAARGIQRALLTSNKLPEAESTLRLRIRA